MKDRLSRKKKPPRDPDRATDRSFRWYKRHPHAFDFCPQPSFFELADAMVEARRTKMAYDRFYVLWQAIRNTAAVPGAAAEAGSYRGGSAFFIASAYVHLTGAEVPFHVFDTFEGHPEQAVTVPDVQEARGHFSDTSYEDVREYLAPFTQLRIHKGDVLATLGGLPEMTFRFVHLDTDLYLPTLRCLEYFAPRLSPGAAVVVDDYASRKSPGVSQAVREFVSRGGGLDVWDPRTEQLLLRKLA